MKTNRFARGWRWRVICAVALLALAFALLPLRLFAAGVTDFTVTLPSGVTPTGARLTSDDDPNCPKDGTITGSTVVFDGTMDDDYAHTVELTGMDDHEDLDVDIPANDPRYASGFTIVTSDLTEKDPEIEIISTHTGDWTNQNVTVEGTVTINSLHASDDFVYYSTDSGDYPNKTPTGAIKGKESLTSGTFSITFSAEVDTVYFWAFDDNSPTPNVSPLVSVDVNIDKTKPTITDITLAEAAGAPALTLWNFGTFSNDDVTVTVTADDVGGPGFDSGLDEIELTYKIGGTPQPALTATTFPAEFILPLNDTTRAEDLEFTVVATDNASNASTVKKPTDFTGTNGILSDTLMLEDIETDITITTQAADYTDGDGKKWYDSTATQNYTVEVEDPDSGLQSVDIELNGAPVSVTQPGTSAKETTKQYSGLSTGVLNEGENTIEVTVVDNAGNETVETASLWVDTKEPSVKDIAIEARNPFKPMGTRNFQSYGTFFNDKVLVTVTAADATAGCGVSTITLYADGTSLGTKTATGGVATFEVPAGGLPFDGTLTALATDFMGNKKTLPEFVLGAGSRLKSDRLVLEAVKPTVGITLPTPTYTDSKNRNWYDGGVDFDITTNDATAGIRSVEIDLNGVSITRDANGKAVNAAFYSSQTLAESFTVATRQAPAADDGSYTLTVTVVDNAGNTIERTRVLYIDTSAPKIVDFTFSDADGAQDLNRQDEPEEKTDYGYYFKAKTQVTITAEDPNPASGVAAITYYTVDINGVKSAEVTKRTKEKVTFTLPANFKGQIFATAVDNMGRAPGSYKSSRGVIVESKGRHLEESHIQFQKAAAPFTDDKNRPLYAKDTAVAITLTDTFSGLRRVEWSVLSPQDTEQNVTGSIDLAGSGGISGDAAGWRVTGKENNLITKLSKTLIVTNDSNNIRVWVKTTDRAGHVTEDYITFSIDKTAPTISVTYDNNDTDPEFQDYYKADRTATIVIAERNFRPGDVDIDITNTDGSIPELSGWTTTENGEDPDQTTHTATLAYTAEGDYTFDIACSDKADNPAAPFTQHTFTIDKTLPTIDVSYDNNQAANGHYYSASRTATITITEHNFETGRVNIIGRATDDGAATAFPAESGWATSGDVHTATISYANDADYTFDIEYTDMAGNPAADFTEQNFVVDQTPPTLEIVGVADKSANNGDVIPVVRFSDTNYTQDTVSITLSGAVRQAVPLSGGYSAQNNGQIYTFENFERKKEVDDIYTLSAALTDLAGNEISETITFSVNRFGSVYVFNDALKAIEGVYVRDEVDIVVTETNIDSLEHDTIKVKVAYNGVPHTLTEGKDYTVAHTGGDGSWSQYEYSIPKSQFTGEGSYVVTLYSVDSAGNINENIQSSKKAEIAFGIDKTQPSIVPVNLQSGQQYPVEELLAEFSVADNLVLEEVHAFLNGEEIEVKDAENPSVLIPAANDEQTVRIVAVDAAGNENVMEIEDLLITTNFLSRWYHNTALFAGTLGGAVLLAALVIFAVVRVRSRKKA